jgi:CHAT domain-containing protein
MVERVRRLPKCKYFLKPIPFQQLRKASTAGLVIVINASEYAVDALIFNATGPIQHVSLPDINLEILTGLSNDIVLNQPINFSETQQQNYVTRFLKPTLRTVWSDIVAPIFDRIHVPLVESVLPQCRIWWYPTGPLTFIPIHAAGSGSTGIDVSNLVISSYVITLQSLFRLQKTASLVPKGQLKLLSISQPNTPGQSSLPQTIEEVDEVATVFCSSGWPKENIVCLWGSEATVDKVSHSLESCSWVHFACHGSQDPILGMKSAFILQDGHLELGKIASKWLPNAQFAFLSACHAASGLREVPGEAMHLAAGVQFSGFKSVIATMWAIHDRDAPRVANYTYRYLFRNGLHGLDPCEAATALNYAVRRLRQDPTVTVDRWAPFIHFGI